jgi:hypothetical protein
MKRVRFVGIPMVLCTIAFLGIVGLAVESLWNGLMPLVFKLPAIGFWQALGLLVLSRLLFGRFGGWGRGMRRARWSRGWQGLTPDQRQRFREAMGTGGCGKFDGGEVPDRR